jgi:purple acid phosphatase-like protein/calcineurin-like phosphoesterase family protein
MKKLDRREVLGGMGAGAVLLGVGPTLWRQPAVQGAPGIEQVHLQFGADAAREMTVSWATAGSVRRPRLRYGSGDPADLGDTVDAATRTYTDHATGREVVVHHATVRGLDPDTAYAYRAEHEGAAAVDGGFRTAPAGPARFGFTSFGDQGVAGESLGTAAPDIVVDHVEHQAPLFHLVNGDLAYSDLAADPAGAWDRWFTQNERSAAARPWMPAAGNHEQETGNGDQGFAAFQNRFLVPDNGIDGLGGLFYAFTVGSVRFVALQNDDVCYQWASDDYVRGYSGGEQRRWLDRTLAEARDDPAVDWIVVWMHQLVMSSAVGGNGCDLGVREEFAPLFDEHGVDLVLCGHDHDYERTHPVRGVDPDSHLLRPQPVDDATDVVDASAGAVHMVLGGGGNPVTYTEFGDGPQGARVVVGQSGRFVAEYDHEEPVWSAVTDTTQAYGFAGFEVDPGEEGGTTSIAVTYYRTAATAGQPATPYDRFRLEKPRHAPGPDAAATNQPERSDDASSNAWPIAVGAAAVTAAAAGGAVVLRSRHRPPAVTRTSDPTTPATATEDDGSSTGTSPTTGHAPPEP